MVKELGASGETWKDKSIPVDQYEIVKQEVKDLKAGKPNQTWKTIQRVMLEHLPEQRLNLIDIGCASGYFYEIFTLLFKNKFKYTGADYSDEMLKLAKKNYPAIKVKKIDVRDISLPDCSYDVVFSNAVLEHVPEWKQGLLELARVAGKYLILSKTPVIDGDFKTEQKYIYGGVPVFFNNFNRDEFVQIVLDQGFQLICEEKTHPHPNNIYKIFIFKREEL